MAVVKLKLPEDVKKLRSLKAGDVVYITGELITARDRTYLKLFEEGVDLSGRIIYHCGPVIKREGSGFRILSAGPTTSTRMQHLIAKAVELGAIGFIGKGEVDASVLKGKAFYGLFPGGAGALAASKIKEVRGVLFLEELGPTEASWVIYVENFGPVIIAVDVEGNSLFCQTGSASS